MKRRVQITRVLAVGALLASAYVAGHSSTAVAASKAPILIGADVPLTGALAYNGQQLQRAYQLAISEVNNKGGVDGRKVKLIVEDDQFTPTGATNAVRKLIVEDHVDALLGTYGSAVALAASAVAEQYHVPNIQPFASAPEMVQRGYKYLFNTFPLTSQIETTFSQFVLKDVKPKTAAILYIDNPFAIAGDQTETEHLQKAGVNILVNQKVPTGLSNYTSVLSQIKAAKVDLLSLIIYLPDDLVIMKELQQLDISPKVVYVESSIHLEPTVAQALGETADWVMATPTWYPGAPIPGTKTLAKNFVNKFHTAASIETFKGYQAAAILLDAMKLAKSANKGSVRKELATTKFKTVGGTLHFLKDGQLVSPLLVVQLQHMKPVVVWPKSKQSHKWIGFKSWSSR